MAEIAPDDSKDRDGVVSFIKHHAAKGPDAIRDVVKQGHDELMDGITGLSVEQAAFKPAPDEWSVLETMTHIIEVKTGVREICEALARGESPKRPSAEVQEARMRDGFSNEPFVTPEEAIEAATKADDALVGFVVGLSDETNTEKTHNHPFFGDLNCREWAVYQRAHDDIHSGQIAEIRASGSFPANAAK